MAARTDANLTQMQLAERLGRPQSFVSKIERGERRVDVIELFEVTQAIGVDAFVFLTRFWAEDGSREGKARRENRSRGKAH